MINNKDYPDLITKIKGELIEKSNMRSKNIWKYLGDISNTLSHVMLALSTILAFAAGFFKIAILSFLSGCFSTIALSLTQFSMYALKESRERTHRVNTILNKLGISEIPDLVAGSVDINDGGMFNNKNTEYQRNQNNIEYDKKEDIMPKNNSVINKFFNKFKKSKKECEDFKTIDKTELTNIQDTIPNNENSDIHIDIIDTNPPPLVFLKTKRYSKRSNSESDAI